MSTKVTNTMPNEYYGQHATSQASRTNFTPGKANAGEQDMNWPKEFRPAVAGRGQLYFGRTFELGRMSVSDSDIDEPIIGSEKRHDSDWME